MKQYYGVTETGQTRYVAMSEQEVEEYAKAHPEEKIVRIEDKWGSIKKSLREYIEPAYTGSGHKVKDATSDKFNIGDRVQFDDGDWKNRTGTIKDIFENNYGVVCAEVTFDHAFKNYPGGTTMALKSLRKLDESFTRKTLRESLKDWDRKEFEENSRSFELEMLYESVKTTLSAQQKNDLARFVRKAKTAEEVNTYMTGMIAQDQMSESYADKDAGEIEDILANSDILWSWGDDNTIDFAGKYEAKKAAELLKRFKGSIDFEENQLIFESLKEEKVYSPRDSISKGFDKKIEDILDDNGIIETVEYGAINDVSPKRALKIKNILDNLGYNCEILNDYDICQILIKESLTEDVDEAFDKEPHEFWYYTKHGLGPGTVPKDVEILDVKEDDNWGTYIKLDKVLTTDELEYYDLKERAPKLEEANEEVGFDIIQAFKSLRNFLMEAKPRFCNEMDMDEDNNTITVFIDYGDWKHDHYYLNSLIKEWASSNNIECSIEEYVTFEDGSDTYSAEHIISFEDDLEEGYIEQKPQRFTNGQLKDFDPSAFIKLIMRSGKSMNSVRDCGKYQYTIFVNYQEHFGPRGVDDLDTLYTINIIEEDPKGNQSRTMSERNLTWSEVAEALKGWKDGTILLNDMRQNVALSY